MICLGVFCIQCSCFNSKKAQLGNQRQVSILKGQQKVSSVGLRGNWKRKRKLEKENRGKGTGIENKVLRPTKKYQEAINTKEETMQIPKQETDKFWE